MSVLGFCCGGATDTGLQEKQTNEIFGFFGTLFLDFLRGKTEVHCDSVFLLSPLKPALSKATAFLHNAKMTSSKKARENQKQERRNPASGKKSCAHPPSPPCCSVPTAATGWHTKNPQGSNSSLGRTLGSLRANQLCVTQTPPLFVSRVGPLYKVI